MPGGIRCCSRASLVGTWALPHLADPLLPSVPRASLFEGSHTHCLWMVKCPVSEAGVPNLQDLMPDDLRWDRCNNNSNKVHSNCNVLESSQNHPPTLVHGKKLSSMKPVRRAKKDGDRSSKAFCPLQADTEVLRVPLSSHLQPVYSCAVAGTLTVSLPPIALPWPLSCSATGCQGVFLRPFVCVP